MNKKTIMTNGVFDAGLHHQHVNLLLFCRALAGPDGLVYVCLDADEKVASDKGIQRPIFSYEEREESIYAIDLSGIGGVNQVIDRVIPFYSEQDLKRIIKDFKPDYLIKGADWKNKIVIGSEFAKEVIFFPRTNDISTTKIIERIK